MGLFYVYAHFRKTDNSVFYIGKGSGQRAFTKHGRNAMWNDVFKKHGCMVSILSKWENEDDAFLEEERLIKEIGITNLTNMAYGGRGSKGVVLSKERKELLRKRMEKYISRSMDLVKVAQAKCRKRIFTECGRSFLGAAKACDWMRDELLIVDANQQRINRAAKIGGNHKGIYFRYKDVDFMEKPEVGHRSITVGNSDGDIFPSIKKAAQLMRKAGHKVTSAGIHGAINGSQITAGGKRWGYVVDGKIEIKEFVRKTKNKKIKRSDGVCFDSLLDAAMSTVGKRSGSKNISLCALGRTKTAYGYKWEYL